MDTNWRYDSLIGVRPGVKRLTILISRRLPSVTRFPSSRTRPLDFSLDRLPSSVADVLVGGILSPLDHQKVVALDVSLDVGIVLIASGD